MEDDPIFAREVRRSGALGYVLKEAADRDLIDAVRRAAEGRTYINRRLAARLIADRMSTESFD